jgi:hypothetical protein
MALPASLSNLVEINPVRRIANKPDLLVVTGIGAKDTVNSVEISSADY